jgi:hypothetical protein
MRQFLALLARHGVMVEDSWRTWRIVLIGVNGEKLDAAESAVFHQFAGREPPTAPASLAAFFIGRRGGKDVAAAVQLLYLALCCPWKLARGEVGVVLLLAVDRAQARVAYNYVRGLLDAVPILGSEVENVTADTISLHNGIVIQIATSDFASVRGRTVVAAVLDEYAFWPAEQAVEVLRALKPSQATQPDARLIVITSVYASHGPAYDIFARWGQDTPREIVIRGTTRHFNPTVSQDFIDAEIEADPAAASAEYLSIPRSDVEAFIDRALLDSCTRAEPRELPYVAMHSGGGPVRYFGAIDISGGRNDAAAAAVVLRRADRPNDVILAATRRWAAPHDPSTVAREAKEFFALYRLDTVYCDAYAAELSVALYREAGLGLVRSTVTTSEAFANLLPMLASRRVEVSDDPALRREVLALERRTGRAGKDSISHPPRGRDDVAASVAHAVSAAARSSTRPFNAEEIQVARLQVLDGFADAHHTGRYVG